MVALGTAFLVCHLSLPGNIEKSLSAKIENNEAHISHRFDVRMSKGLQSYVIDAEVMNLHLPPNGTIRGYVQIKQEVQSTQQRSYAINHCFKLPCEMSVLANLNGVGSMAVCTLEKTAASAMRSKRAAEVIFKELQMSK